MIFWDSVDTIWSADGTPNKNLCWEWKNTKGTNKYGTTSYKGKSMKSHRLAWMFYFGDVPDGLCVCHHCDNRSCCNPFHLFLGTNQDNVDDRERKGRNKMPLSRGEEHGIHKLTENQIREIKNLYETGNHSYKTLADIFSVSFGNIRKIVKGQTWGWLE